jgi:hypothetical protein
MGGLIVALIYTLIAVIGALAGFIVSWFLFRV